MQIYKNDVYINWISCIFNFNILVHVVVNHICLHCVVCSLYHCQYSTFCRHSWSFMHNQLYCITFLSLNNRHLYQLYRIMYDNHDDDYSESFRTKNKKRKKKQYMSWYNYSVGTNWKMSSFFAGYHSTERQSDSFLGKRESRKTHFFVFSVWLDRVWEYLAWEQHHTRIRHTWMPDSAHYIVDTLLYTLILIINSWHYLNTSTLIHSQSYNVYVFVCVYVARAHRETERLEYH